MSPRRWLYKHAFGLYKLADDYPLNLEIDKLLDEIEALQVKALDASFHKEKTNEGKE